MWSNCYNALPDEEKKEWMKRNENEHTAALAEWEANKNRKALSDPIEIQKCIHNLSQFMHPILNQVAKAMNGKLTLLWEGPEPIDRGHLNVISICSGKTLGPGGQNFIDSEKDLYRKVIEPMYARFLKKCYSTKPSGHSRRPSSLPMLSQLLVSKSTMVAQTGATVPVQIQPTSQPPSLAPSSPTPLRPATPPAASQPSSPLISLPPPLLPLLIMSEVASNLTASSGHLAQPSINTDEAQALKDANIAPISTLDSIYKPNQLAGTDGQGDDGPKKKGLKNTVKEHVGAEELIPLLASIVFPSSDPPWVINVLEMFKSRSFGPDWSEVVYLWVAFQITNNFDSDNKLSAKERPECVGQWIARARSQKWRPTYANLDIISSMDVNWECLKTYLGKNSLVSVMAVLFFWSAGVEALPQTMHCERARYKEAQKELMFAMGDALYAL
ncbi:hypothetical protein EDD18DRAFT_1090008 [Armillaria luteobubalina]|uniref:Uncharacterized protein n=1 Tax=Armillaria luteobubalina TaxID=153913 RepID=A0AA39TA26_9AGAR|nr:hypothetical protein EDD18DRAFT_1090008 [Armillaria luteobubalina]